MKYFTFKRFSYVRFFFNPIFWAISEKNKCINKTNATMILYIPMKLFQNWDRGAQAPINTLLAKAL